MKSIFSPRRPTATAAEVEQYNETRARESKSIGERLSDAVRTLGTPAIWTEVLGIVVPIASTAAAGLVRGLHPESPGGAKLTRAELQAIARRAGEQLEDAIIGAFLDRVTGDPEPERPPRALAFTEPPPSDLPPEAA